MPRFWKLCKKCEKCNHFAKVCRSKQAKRVENVDKESERDSSDENTNGFFVDTVSQSENPQSQNKTTDKQYNIEMRSNQDDQTAWFISINTSGSDINYKIDTGAQANIIPQCLYNSLRKKPKLHSTKEKLFAYDGSEIPVVGKCIARLKPKRNADYPVQFFVVSTKSCPTLGLKTCRQLNLIKWIWQISQPHLNVKNIPEEYSEAFGEIGCLSGEYHINLTPDAIPVVHPLRKVPYLLKDKLKKELDRIEKMTSLNK